MALVHNALIRGFNSVVVQAPHVGAADARDFVAYARTWVKFLRGHHDDEEAVLFPQMALMLRDDELWGDMHQEHGEPVSCPVCPGARVAPLAHQVQRAVAPLSSAGSNPPSLAAPLCAG